MFPFALIPVAPLQQTTDYAYLTPEEVAKWLPLVDEWSECKTFGTNIRSRYEAAIELKILCIKLSGSEPVPNEFLTPEMFWFYQSSLGLNHLEIRALQSEGWAFEPNSIFDGYARYVGYTHTPELDQTPDRHWAKISLDLLYKQGIFKGQPKTRSSQNP